MFNNTCFTQNLMTLSNYNKNSCDLNVSRIAICDVVYEFKHIFHNRLQTNHLTLLLNLYNT